MIFTGLTGKEFREEYSKSLKKLKEKLRKLEEDRKKAFKMGRKSLAKRRTKAIRTCKSALMNYSTDIIDRNEMEIVNQIEGKAEIFW